MEKAVKPTLKKPGKLRLLLPLLIVGLLFVWLYGSQYIQAENHPVGPAPADLPVETVSLRSYSGSTLKGWYVPGTPGKGSVVLLHGYHTDRTSMTNRARFLHAAGYSVLLFDFQAHGESPGQTVTFGQLESLDAIAAVRFIRLRQPRDKVAVLGIGLGGMAAVLARPSLDVDAYILESVPPSLEQLTRNRLDVRLGRSGQHLAPLLLWQLRPRIGVSFENLRPIDRLARIHSAKLLITGTEDPLTKLKESMAMFLTANEPKQLWAIDGAQDQDFWKFNSKDYEQHVLDFLQKYLR